MPMLTPFSTMRSRKGLDVTKAKAKKSAPKKVDLLHTLLEELIRVGINLARHKF